MATEKPFKSERVRRVRRAEALADQDERLDTIDNRADRNVQIDLLNDAMLTSGCSKDELVAVPNDVYVAIAIKTVASLCPMVKYLGGDCDASAVTRFAMKMNYMGFKTEIMDGARVGLKVGVNTRPPIVPPALTPLNQLVVKTSTVLTISFMAPFVSEKAIDSPEIKELVEETGCSVAVPADGRGTEVTVLRGVDSTKHKRKRNIQKAE